jgi:hypothetical protein
MNKLPALLFLSTITAASVFAESTLEHEERTIPSHEKALSVSYEWILDEPTGTEYTHQATLLRGAERPWSFTAKGRAIVFSWSPDSRYLLFGVVLPGRDMALYLLDAHSKNPKEQDLKLGEIERRVEAALPERSSGSFMGRSQVDFEKVQWLSDSECRLHYFYSFDRKGGDADLSLDVRTGNLKIISISPLAE